MNGAEWFKHDADMSADEKVIYLESQFGLVGYALFNKMLEVLSRASDNRIQWNEFQCGVYARKFGCERAMFQSFIEEATRPEVAAFLLQDGWLFSNGLIKRLAPMYEKRARNAEKVRKYRQSKKGKAQSNEMQSNEVQTDDVTVTYDLVPVTHPAHAPNDTTTNEQSREEYSREEQSRKTHPPTPANVVEMPEALKALKGFAQEWEKWEKARKSSVGAARAQLETLLEHFANGYDPRKIVKFSVEADFRALARPTDDMKFPARAFSQSNQQQRHYVAVEMPQGGVNPTIRLDSLDFSRAEHLRDKALLTYDEYQLLKKTNAPNTA
ncbi:MAG: DUF4373 domain-containing protein [Candidatus Kapaibacterium sp.]|nr:MAG: DUF4373 domain-containing protein [Candidatus Kapabacteria bacterium]